MGYAQERLTCGFILQEDVCHSEFLSDRTQIMELCLIVVRECSMEGFYSWVDRILNSCAIGVVRIVEAPRSREFLARDQMFDLVVSHTSFKKTVTMLQLQRVALHLWSEHVSKIVHALRRARTASKGKGLPTGRATACRLATTIISAHLYATLRLELECHEKRAIEVAGEQILVEEEAELLIHRRERCQ